jgi:hypothetical protein
MVPTRDTVFPPTGLANQVAAAVGNTPVRTTSLSSEIMSMDRTLCFSSFVAMHGFSSRVRDGLVNDPHKRRWTFSLLVHAAGHHRTTLILLTTNLLHRQFAKSTHIFPETEVLLYVLASGLGPRDSLSSTCKTRHRSNANLDRSWFCQLNPTNFNMTVCLYGPI